MLNITNKIQWDEGRPYIEQTQEAQGWYDEFIQPNLSFIKDEINKIQPIWDEYNRPRYWDIAFDNNTYRIFYFYVKPFSSEWGLKTIILNKL